MTEFCSQAGDFTVREGPLCVYRPIVLMARGPGVLVPSLCRNSRSFNFDFYVFSGYWSHGLLVRSWLKLKVDMTVQDKVELQHWLQWLVLTS